MKDFDQIKYSKQCNLLRAFKNFCVEEKIDSVLKCKSRYENVVDRYQKTCWRWMRCVDRNRLNISANKDNTNNVLV